MKFVDDVAGKSVEFLEVLFRHCSMGKHPAFYMYAHDHSQVWTIQTESFDKHEFSTVSAGVLLTGHEDSP